MFVNGYYIPTVGPVQQNGRQRISVLEDDAERVIETTPEKIKDFMDYRQKSKKSWQRSFALWSLVPAAIGLISGMQSSERGGGVMGMLIGATVGLMGLMVKDLCCIPKNKRIYNEQVKKLYIEG